MYENKFLYIWFELKEKLKNKKERWCRRNERRNRSSNNRREVEHGTQRNMGGKSRCQLYNSAPLICVCHAPHMKHQVMTAEIHNCWQQTSLWQPCVCVCVCLTFHSVQRVPFSSRSALTWFTMTCLQAGNKGHACRHLKRFESPELNLIYTLHLNSAGIWSHSGWCCVAHWLNW